MYFTVVLYETPENIIGLQTILDSYLQTVSTLKNLNTIQCLWKPEV